ncbi:hypothetical protein PR001_g22316 [Phytophthora rubi]|uniref:Uncharacterized protein n=1 Tax=Phytophthora rubi TaxID=129364 RepID=A0A6A3IWN7_9STRA|nr:hypothetical protein PR001_g22316 [Phytophthora rubi]KAE9024217.1 hypothetical protein PR002_g11516 [Phytophthora rubi]
MASFDILLWEGIAAYHGPLYDLPEAICDTVVKATVGAAENGHLDIVEYVVKEVVDGDENDDSGRMVPPWSDIHLALEGDAVRSVSLLLLLVVVVVLVSPVEYVLWLPPDSFAFSLVVA